MSPIELFGTYKKEDKNLPQTLASGGVNCIIKDIWREENVTDIALYQMLQN